MPSPVRMDQLRSKSDQVSRERVMGLTLVDIFIQLVFLLLSLLLLYYVENLDSSKWEVFWRDGTSIYGADFANTWQTLPARSAPAKTQPAPVAIDVKPVIPSVESAHAPGRKACLPENGKAVTYSGKFQYTANGIKFLGFTTEFNSYIETARADIRAQVQTASQYRGNTLSPQELRRIFSPISGPTCQHFYAIDESLMKDWMNGPRAVKLWQEMRGAINAIK